MIINKKKIYSRFILIIFFSVIISEDVLPLTQRYFHREDMGYNYSRGTYLIVLADASLESILQDESTGDFIHFKKTFALESSVQWSLNIFGICGPVLAYLGKSRLK